MDWKQILSLSNENLTDERKEEIYHELVKDQKFDSKIAKKLFPLCLSILKFKGQQVEKQRDEIEMLASSDIDLKSTLEQMEKQKKQLSKYEAERTQYKARIKELSDEIAMMHGRELQGSDEDSPDQLSEINKQQELMAEISAKNKHIKRLLRDIEKHEKEAMSHVLIIKNLKVDITEASEKIASLEARIAEMSVTAKFYDEKVQELTKSIMEREVENHQLLKERQEKDEEIQAFSAQVEERMQLYKGILDEKQREIDALKERYETLIEQVPGIDIENVEMENKRLTDSSKEKDEVIKVYDEKIQQLSAELMDSTKAINKMVAERNELMEKLSRNRSENCCEETRQLLERSNERIMEMQEMLEKADEDNMLKSKQAFEAIETLKSYENSTDGLADALKKIHRLQETVHQRDKQIQQLVVEVNAQNEVVAENCVLRRRLGMPDDEIVETKAFLAKQKRHAKINDRLAMKLRASEDMRLQLKIEKNDLKRRISELESQLRGNGGGEAFSKSTSESSEQVKLQRDARRESHRVEMKQCENCCDLYNVYESLKYCRDCIMRQNLCENCTTNYKVTSTENIELTKKIAKLEIDHQSIVEENENLRIGLNEILEKLRDYEGSDKAIVNPATLEKLLYILNLRNSMRTSDESGEVATEKTNQQNVNDNDDDKLTTHAAESLQLKLLVKSLSDENEAIKADLERMRGLEELHYELIRSSELCDDDKHRLLVKSLERCHEFEVNLAAYERKIDYLKNENDNLHRELRSLKVSSIELMNDMKMEILNKTQEMITIEAHDNGDNDDDDGNIDTEENESINVEEELRELRLQLNGLCLNVLKNIKSLDSDNLLESSLKEKLSNVTIIENELTTSFITRDELDALKSSLAKARETIGGHEMRVRHLEELVKVTQHQLKAQQIMLSQFSEEEVTARHLIVDLQSQSNENYLLTKATRELKTVKESEDHLRLENDKLRSDAIILEERLLRVQTKLAEQTKEFNKRESSNLLKIQYLKKSLVHLCHQYSTMTPIYQIADFIKHYCALLEAKKRFDVENLAQMRSQSMPEVLRDSIAAQSSEMSMTDVEAKIEIIKYRASCDYLKHQLDLHEATIKELHNEIARIKINEIKSTQHWSAIRMLFESASGEKQNAATATIADVDEKVKFDKEIQVDVLKNDCGTNTEVEQASRVTPVSSSSFSAVTCAQVASESDMQRKEEVASTPVATPSRNDEQVTLEVQLKKALSLASSRVSLLIETENRLSEAQGRIKALERSLENRPKQMIQPPIEERKPADHITGITIATLQNLIVDKDANISRYQEILKAERQHHIQTYDELSEQIKQLKKVIDSHETTIDERNKSIEKLKSSAVDLNERLATAQQRPLSPVATKSDDLLDMETRLREAHTEMKKMEQQVKDLTNTERLLRNIIAEKDVQVKDLNVKLKATSDNLETLSENYTSTPEIDNLREMLEEKDKHIQDLTETLNQFHDDQQQYITDTALNSAEQVTVLSANLQRVETKCRVLETQLEAAKRQCESYKQRDKSSRDLIKTLKTQLIRRPVISVRSDKRMTQREEQQQKRISELESELLETKDELRRQININDNKKAKNAAELGLWDKQKRFQELSEKLKAKLTDRELDVERLKSNMQIAKNQIKRLENEKISLENKLKSDRFLHNMQSSSSHDCHMCASRGKHVTTTVSSQMSDSSFYSDTGVSDTNHELVAALKSRIVSLQRRIVALELDGKGQSAFVAEFERMQEKLAELKSTNVKLEGDNARLVIDVAMLKQQYEGKQNESREKHLEDYIFVLKQELANARVPATSQQSYPSTPSRSHDDNSGKEQAKERTILQLKSIVEKLNAENKYLRSRPSTAGSSVPPTSTYMKSSDRKKEELYEKLKTDYEKVRKGYEEALKTISFLQIELELSQAQTITASCPHCDQKNQSEMATQDIDSLKQQLQHKKDLLERARQMLLRAAAKEKQLKEMNTKLTRRIRELEGHPVISEENSESSEHRSCL